MKIIIIDKCRIYDIRWLNYFSSEILAETNNELYILLEKSPNTLQKNANYSLTDYEKWPSQKNFYNRIVSNLLLIYYTSQLSF